MTFTTFLKYTIWKINTTNIFISWLYYYSITTFLNIQTRDIGNSYVFSKLENEGQRFTLLRKQCYHKQVLSIVINEHNSTAHLHFNSNDWLYGIVITYLFSYIQVVFLLDDMSFAIIIY